MIFVVPIIKFFYNFLAENPDLSKSRIKAKNYTLRRTEGIAKENLGFQLGSSKLWKKTPDFQSGEVYKNRPLLLIIFIALFLRLFRINQAFPFDYDQEVPASAAYDFFINHKITLIGQELSFKGFFLGPLHNWIQFIPYGICNLKPDCVPYFYTMIGILTVIILYLVVKRIFDIKTATMSSAIYAISFSAISFERGVNSNYFLFLVSVGLLFCLYTYFLGKNKYIIFGAFIAGIATVNFNPIYIFSTIAFFVTALIRKSRKLAFFLIAFIAFAINYLPLLIFNARHHNILWSNFLAFTNQNAIVSDYFGRFIFLTKNVLVSFYSNFLFQNASIIFILFTTFLVLWGLINLLKTKNKFLLFFPIWISSVLFGFTLYKGWVPDYYFQQTLLPLAIIIAFTIRKNFVIFLIFICIFLFINIKRDVNYNTVINYKVKKDAVNFVINDSKGETFNVYYQMPLALNTGYRFLFKVFGELPLEGGRNLYIFEFEEPSYYLKLKYQKAFPSKKVDVGFDEFVKIVSIKNVN